MDTEQEKRNGRSDHDILIRVETIVEGLVNDMRDMKEGTGKRLDLVEKGIKDLELYKYSKTDADKLDDRVSIVESFRWWMIGALAAWSVIISAVLYFKK